MNTVTAVTVGSVLTSAGVIVGILTALLTLSAVVYRTVRRLEDVVGVDGEGRTISERIGHVERQVFPNGGSSLSDQVKRTEHLARETAAEVRVVREMLTVVLDAKQHQDRH